MRNGTKRNETKIGNPWQIALEFRSVFYKMLQTMLSQCRVIRHSIDVTRLNLTNQTHPIRSDPKSRCHYGWARIKTHCRSTLVYNVYTIHILCVWCNKNFCIGCGRTHNRLWLACIEFRIYENTTHYTYVKCSKLKQQQHQQQLQFDTLLYRWVQFCVSTQSKCQAGNIFLWWRGARG